MFEALTEINRRPEVFSVYTAAALWTDAHRTEQMLAFHLNEKTDVSSRNTTFIDASASWIIEHFALSQDKSICDFGCGPGLYTTRLAASGARVTGVDFSENSLRYARGEAAKANQRIDYIQGDYLAFVPSERFDLITLIMCDFCALSPAQRARLLAIFHQSLKEGGAVLLDVYSMTAFAQREEACFYEKNQLSHFWSEHDYYCFVNTYKYEPEAVVLDKYSIFPQQGEPETVYNWLQHFSPENLREELSTAGFRIDKIYQDVSGADYSDQHTEFAVVARRADDVTTSNLEEY